MKIRFMKIKHLGSIVGIFFLASMFCTQAFAVSPVVWTNPVDVTVTGNTIEKTAGCQGCTAGAVSQQSIASGNGYIEFSATAPNEGGRAGISSNSTNSTNTLDLKFAIGLGGGVWVIREDDIYRTEGTYVANDIFRIAYESGVAKYYKNGALIYTSALAPVYPAYFDTSIFDLNKKVSNAMIENFSATGSVKLYPSNLRITKGKSNTATAVFKNAGGVHSNATFSFSSSNPSIATATNDPLTSGGTSTNLASVKGLASGTATITGTANGLTTNALTVTVDDPAATAFADIHGDNDASGGSAITTKVGEPIEINAESSTGVNSLEWDWGDSDKTTEEFSATHAYFLAGTYTLSLKVTNSLGSISTDTVVVTVQNFAAPTATFTVTTAQQLIDAYNLCNGGEHIVIPAGTTLVGNIVLPARTFSDYVTIRSSGTMPDIRNRISPTDPGLATMQSTAYSERPLTISNNVAKLRIIGIKFAPFEQTQSDEFSLIEVGGRAQTSLSTNPQKIIFQHIVMNPPDTTMVRHGMWNDGYKVSVISSWLGNIFVRCFPGSGCITDSNAIFSLNGKGAHVYNNSYIEASTENIIYGGDVVSVDGHTPTNIEIRRSYFFKRLAWKPNPTPLFNIKNLIEFKIGRRVYLEGNIFENHWLGADAGQPNAININSLEEPDSPWTVTEDINFENNKVVEMPSGILLANSYYAPVGSGLIYNPRKANNIRFKNMLFNKFNGLNNNSSRLILLNGAEDVLLDRITQVDSTQNTNLLMSIATRNNYRFQMTNSILGMGNQYQIFADGGAFGRCGLNFATGAGSEFLPCDPNGFWNVSNNIFVRYNTDALVNPPANNCDSAVGFGSVGFVDLANGDYRLSGSGPCYTGQTNIGADIPVLNNRTACAVSGQQLSCGTALPTAPSALAATTVSTTQINLAWTDNSTNETGFRVERSTDNVTFTEIGTTAANVTTFNSTTLTSGTTYYYRVRAYNAGGNSAYSNTASATTAVVQAPYPGPAIPNLPVTLQAENFDKGGQGVSYNEVFGATSSSVYRSTPVETVDLQANASANNGFVVFEAGAGEWLEYTVNAPATALYDIGVRYSNGFTTGAGALHVEVCDAAGVTCTNVTGSLTTSPTGSWSTFATLTKYNVSVSAGNHVIRLAMDTNAPELCACVVGNMDSISFTASAIPAAPSGLTAVVNTTTGVTLNWLDNSPNETGFQVSRLTTTLATCPTTGYTLVSTTAANAVTFPNTGLTANTTYCYEVKSVNGVGASAGVRVMTRTAAPTAPSGLALTVISRNQINLAWVDNSNNETNFEIQRCSGSATCTPVNLVTNIAPNTLTYQNTGLTPATIYRYRVRAINGAGASAYTAIVNATTLP